jgi:hypothetical protein
MSRRTTEHLDERGCYDIGRHLVRLVAGSSGWTVSVDGLTHDRSFRTQGEAWAAGVATAELLDTWVACRPGGRRVG